MSLANFTNLWNNFSHYSFEYFFVSLIILFSLWDSDDMNSIPIIVIHKFLGLCLFLFFQSIFSLMLSMDYMYHFIFHFIDSLLCPTFCFWPIYCTFCLGFYIFQFWNIDLVFLYVFYSLLKFSVSVLRFSTFLFQACS